MNDNQFGQSNYYSTSPGLQNNYTVVPDSPYYDPNQEYGRSLLDSPHKIVIAPQFNLNFSKSGGWREAVLSGWVVFPAITLQSGFPIGVSQNVNGTLFLFGGTIRPNVVPDQDFLVDGNITDRITANPSDNLYLNKNAFANASTSGQVFGNAPRTLPGVLSPWRNNVDLSISKQVHTGATTSLSVRLEILNLTNIVQWAAPASAALGNSSFGQITNQANNMRMFQFTFRFGF